jgi:hypothetical protein
MRPRSELLLDLAAGMRPGAVRITSIYSLADNVIVPPGFASLGVSGDNVVFDTLGHMSLLLSPRVADVVAERLLRELPLISPGEHQFAPLHPEGEGGLKAMTIVTTNTLRTPLPRPVL